MTDKRPKARKVKCKRNEIYKKVNISGIYSSLVEAFEVRKWTQYLTKIDQEKR